MEIIIVIIGFALVYAWLFGRSGKRVNFELEKVDDRDVQGDPAEGDFEGRKDLKKHVAEVLGAFACPTCGSRQVSGSRVVVRYGKVHFFREVAEKGWFGRVSYRSERFKTTWRVHEIGLRPGRQGGLFSAAIEPGKLACRAKGCGWKDEAQILPRQSISETLGIEWYSVNDVLQGKPWKR